MAETPMYATSVLVTDEADIVTGGWFQQVQLNKSAFSAHVLDQHHQLGARSTAYLDLARWARSEDAYRYSVHTAADAILINSGIGFRESSMHGYDYETPPLPGGMEETEFLVRLLRGVKIQETIVRQGVLRRRKAVLRETVHYALAVVARGLDGMPQAVVHDSADMSLLSFARKLEPLVYFVKPQLWGDTVFIGDREIMRVTLPGQ